MMSRRSIFIFAAIVVIFYFSVILFMLRPVQVGGGYYGSINNFVLRNSPSLTWCKPLQWRSPPSNHVVALVSYPGSGNTWLRYLLQQATGILTGSVYMDYGLRLHGFPAENVTDGSVLVVKTHEYPPADNKFHSAIILVRNPRDALLADFNRLHKGHIGVAPKSAFKAKTLNNKHTDWHKYVFSRVREWRRLYVRWLAEFRGDKLVLLYERLAGEPRAALRQILRFLRYPATEADLDCAMSHKEGIYRRPKKYTNFDPFTPEMYQEIDKARVKVLYVINEYQRIIQIKDQMARANASNAKL